MNIRTVKSEELGRVYDMVTEIGTLDLHHPYTYWVIFSSSPHLFFVAEEQGEIIGFVCGLENYQGSDTAFLWQIGVLPKNRRKGVACALLQKFIDALHSSNKKNLELTITEDNEASLSLFSTFCEEKGLSITQHGDTGSPIADMKPEIIFTVKLS